MSAYVFVQIGAVSSFNELHNALHAIAGVKSVHLVAGPTDLILFVDTKDQSSLMDTLSKIRGVKGVVSTDTRIVWSV